MSANRLFKKLRVQRMPLHAAGSLLLFLACTCALALPVTANAASACRPWPRWKNFKTVYINADGRVIDVGSPDARTVSEGQAYGLFFSLVANDRAAFNRLLHWTRDNLAQGDLSAHLPAWLWGRNKDGNWGVIDQNAASDADLWMAYTLLQAGRHWQDAALTHTGQGLARRILSEETAQLPGLGLTLLPGPTGFQTAPNTWRLNPSYVPIQVLRSMAVMLPDQPQWRLLAASSQRLLTDSAARGFAMDWVRYQSDGNTGMFITEDGTAAALGSYDAIRAYLWAGMLSPAEPAASTLWNTFRPMKDYVAAHGAPPEKAIATGAFGPNAGNAGFSAAVIPLLAGLGEKALADQQIARIETLEANTPSRYYEQTLILFGLGWYEKRFAFQPDGALDLPSCETGAGH